MYQRMLAHHETAVRETALKFQDTMGQLARVYLAFHEKWMKSGAIENGRAAFVRDFATIDDALSEGTKSAKSLGNATREMRVA